MIQKIHPKLNDEVWVEVPGFPGYKVSNLGRLGSTYNIGARQFRKDCFKVLTPQISKSGYHFYDLMPGDGNRIERKRKPIHQLVLLAFIGPPIMGLEVRHLDGNPGNNNLENLAYGTRQENSDDKLVHGTKLSGESHPGSKLSWSDVDRIREILFNKTMTQYRIAKAFGVNQSIISNIKNNKIWIKEGNNEQSFR